MICCAASPGSPANPPATTIIDLSTLALRQETTVITANKEPLGMVAVDTEVLDQRAEFGEAGSEVAEGALRVAQSKTKEALEALQEEVQLKWSPMEQANAVLTQEMQLAAEASTKAAQELTHAQDQLETAQQAAREAEAITQPLHEELAHSRASLLDARQEIAQLQCMRIEAAELKDAAAAHLDANYKGEMSSVQVQRGLLTLTLAPALALTLPRCSTKRPWLPILPLT